MKFLEKFYNVVSIVFCLLFIVTIVKFLSGCVDVSNARSSKIPGVESSTDPTPKPIPAPEVQTPPTYSSFAWDGKPERLKWSEILKKSIDANWQELKKAKDVTAFCSNWASMSEDLQKEMFAEMFIAIMYFESTWNPLSRMKETTMGTDPVTRLPVYSEGLFQLSYQDEQWIKCGFVWQKDKGLDPKSPQKTILNPELNIDCGVRIMARQITNQGKIILRSGVYWAVIKEGGKYQQISGIKKRVKDNVFSCK